MPISAAGRPTRPVPWRVLAFFVIIAAAGFSCGKTPTECTTCGPTPPPPPTGTAVLIGAGDIALCDPSLSSGTVATAKMLDGFSGATVFAAGDNAYFHGTAAEFRDCYDPHWGRQKGRTLPVPGNHEYETAGAAPYYAYFGDAAGTAGLGYYRRTLGSWTFIGLNSEIDHSAGSVQVQWLRNELATNPTKCTVAVWHRPLFSSGGANGDQPDMRDVWQALYDLNVDVVINGHEHLYEQFARQDPNGNADAARGIQQFTVGTGGASLTTSVKQRLTSRRIISYWGLGVFNLLDGMYTWEFKPIDAGGGTDSGSGSCH